VKRNSDRRRGGGVAMCWSTLAKIGSTSFGPLALMLTAGDKKRLAVDLVCCKLNGMAVSLIEPRIQPLRAMTLLAGLRNAPPWVDSRRPLGDAN